MKILIALLLSVSTWADTPPPNSVKAKVFDGSGTASIGAVGDALKVSVVNGGSGGTVDQGNEGSAGHAWWIQGDVGVAGTVNVANFPATQPVSGTVGISNFPATQAVTGAFFQTTQPVSGTVAISNFPGTQPVSGTVTANQGGAPWDINLTKLGGSTPGATVYLPARITNGTSYVDPTQIRTLTSSDQITIANSSIPVTGAFFQATQPVSILTLPPLVAGTAVIGHVIVDSVPTTTVNGTVTANIGTTNGIALDASVLNPQGSATGGTAAAKSDLAGGIYNATPPTLTDGQQAGLQLDANGQLKVIGTSTVSGSVSVSNFPATQPVSGTLTCNAGTGTLAVSAAALPLPSGAATASKQDTGNNSISSIDGKLAALGQAHSAASMPVVIADDQSAIPVTGAFFQTTQPVSGTLTCNAGSGTLAVSAASLPLPSGASTAAKQPALGTAGSASSDVLTVQGISSMTALKVDGSGVTQPVSGSLTCNAGTNLNTSSLALDATAAALNLSQASTTSGQTGPLIQGATTTSAPTYTTAKTNPLSLTTAGALRTDASATTQPVSGTLTCNAGSGTLAVSLATAPALVASSAVIGHVIVDTAPTTAVTGAFFQATQPVSGTLTCNAGTNLNTSSLALDASVTGLEVAQASTTSGQNGALMQGATTTAAPTYTTAKTNPLSLTTAGALRTDASATTQPVSGTVSCNAGTGTLAVSIATAPALVASSAVIGHVIVDTAPTTAVTIATAPALVASSAIIGKVGIDQTTPGTTNLVSAGQNGTWTVQPGNTANTTAWLVTQAGRATANAPVRNDYTSVNVTTAAYVQLVASTTSATSEIEIFDSSGQTLKLAVGAAASEVDQIIIFPGGNGRIPLKIPASSRVSVKALSATASLGEIDVNFYQ